MVHVSGSDIRRRRRYRPRLDLRNACFLRHTLV